MTDIEAEATFFQAEERTLGAELQKGCISRASTEVTHVLTIGTYSVETCIESCLCYVGAPHDVQTRVPDQGRADGVE